MTAPLSAPAEASSSRYDVRRITGFVRIALGVLALMFAAHLALRSALGVDPDWLRDPAPLDWRYYQRFGTQVAGAEWELEHLPEQFPKKFGVLLGASTIQLGPLPALVEAETGYPWLLLGVGGGPTAITKIRRSLHLLEKAGLHPDTLVFGIHPLWLPSAAVEEEEPTSALSGLWFLDNQASVSNYLYTGMQRAREGLAEELGFGAWMAFTPASDPWHPIPERPIERPRPKN